MTGHKVYNMRWWQLMCADMEELAAIADMKSAVGERKWPQTGSAVESSTVLSADTMCS